MEEPRGSCNRGDLGEKESEGRWVSDHEPVRSNPQRPRWPCVGSGWITLAFRRLCGKSFGLRVKMTSALPASAQIQNASSLGSGEISAEERISTDSPRSRMKLISAPIAAERTCNRFRTSLYSARISSE